MRPPAPSTSPATSPTPRRSVPLKSMCSWKWARPGLVRAARRRSPTRAQICTSATGASAISRSRTVEPVREQLDANAAAGSRGRRGSGGRGRARAGREGTGAAHGAPGKLPPMATLGVYLARAVLRARLPLLRLRGGRGAPARSRRRGALRRGAARASSPRARGAFAGPPPRERLPRRRHAVAAAPGSVRALLDAVRARVPAAGAPEVTLEVNPSTLERERLPGLPRGGRRTASRSASSPSTTARCGGSAARTARTPGARTLRGGRAAGFANLSLDLIVAAPGQDLGALERDLDEAIAAAPEHVSAYELTLEPGTPFARAAARGRLALPGRGARRRDARARRRAARGAPASAATRSRASRGRAARRVHNQRYWERRAGARPRRGRLVDRPAAGAGALRRAPREPARARRLSRGGRGGRLRRGVGGGARRRATARGEAVFLALRTRAGPRRRALRAGVRRAAAGASSATRSTRSARRGCSRRATAGDLALTPRGRLLADTVFGTSSERLTPEGALVHQPLMPLGFPVRWCNGRRPTGLSGRANAALDR